MKDDSDRERAELKSQTRHVHLDMNGMENDVEPEPLVVSGELDRGVAGGAQWPMGPITVVSVMGVLWKVWDFLKNQIHTCETGMSCRGGI